MAVGREWLEQARFFFASGATQSIAARKRVLMSLAAGIEAREPIIWRALATDLGKPLPESCLSETGWVLNDIRHALRHLSAWSRARRRRSPAALWPARCRIEPRPRGAVLVLAPWNYPFQLLFSPMVDALSAGNVVCAKPSELTPEVSRIAATLVRETLPIEWATVIEGDGMVAASLLENRFDHILFTGGIDVGRTVMAAAARFPTPVTLELGGKSPCIVCADTDVRIAARRIVWGKFMNAGQTCVAPDYVLAESAILEPLVHAMRSAIDAFYGIDPRQSPDYGRIVNDRHFARLVSLLEHGERICGGDCDAGTRYIAPTMVVNPPADSPLMQSEIFGPILPVVSVPDVDAALSWVRAQPPPLALYLFTNRRDVRRRFRAETQSGGLCINDTLVQLFNRALPFGGFGPSGFGAYHGRTGFDTFSHARAVVERSLHPDFAVRYPPSRLSLRGLKQVARWMFR